ncbi:hypothetical protein IAQ61_009047, partial [Plenodomus lingam]|uniref:uncharacterized protein n=1 Tax=Leptosphaeria maculans TaxID=5022 RepID=UPI003318D582
MHTPTILSLLLAATTTSAQNRPPVRPPFPNITDLPTRYGLVLFPQFQALDVFGPMDVLNTIDMHFSNYTNMNLTILAKTLDPVTTARQGPQGTIGRFGESIVPTTTFSDYLARNSSADGIEVLLVPGGLGTRRDVTEEINFVRAVYPNLRYILSVCTGATVLARAGVLDGRRATTNKAEWVAATAMGPNTTWVPRARWVEDGNVWSSSGVSAGIDAMLAWVTRVYGEDVAWYTALDMEYRRNTDPNNDPFGPLWGIPGTE